MDKGLFAGLSMASSSGKPEPPMTPTDSSSIEKGAIVDPTKKDTNLSDPVIASPATDKLLNMLGGESSPPPAPATMPGTPTRSTVPQALETKMTTPRTMTKTDEVESEAPSTDKDKNVDKDPTENVRNSLMTPVTERESHRVASGNETEEAFQLSLPSPVQATRQNKIPAPPSCVGAIHEDTQIPNADVSLRLLRKFATKTRPSIPEVYGGTKTLGFLGYFFGSSSKNDYDDSLVPYGQLMKIMIDDESEDIESAREEIDDVVESVLGGSGDSMEKARLAVAAFIHVLSVWCHASQRCEVKEGLIFELVTHAIDTSTSLVAHGCLDHVDLAIAEQNNKGIHVMAESVIVTDLTQERTELATLKFLLTTGCRSTSTGDALLRGTHLLQAIRVMYHVYLTTDSEANKITARASLQQLVTSVFKRMLLTSRDAEQSEGFPSSNHRDAFLVLRAMCKLSMRNLPEQKVHTGLSVSGSSVAWDGGTQEPTSPGKQNGTSDSHSQVQVITVHARHPALESKVLALELLLYVLQNTEMSGNFLQRSGHQFQYAIRNYLCVSLLKNCTSNNTKVVNVSLRLFVPLIRNFRSHLKTEIEAFVTNVFFVILDSKHSTVEHKNLVVILFDEICSDPQTLAEIFLNYDCDLSAVDLFHRIVNTLSRVAKQGIQDEVGVSSISFVAGAGAVRVEKMRSESRQLRLEAMRALRQVLASLHASIVEPMKKSDEEMETPHKGGGRDRLDTSTEERTDDATDKEDKKTLVQIYDSKKKRRAEESEAVLRFNQKPSAGIKYANQCGHIDATDPTDVARYLLKNKDIFDKTQIGDYLGREPTYQEGFSLKVLHEYVNLLDFTGLLFDDAIKYYLSGFRLPGEAQKIDRIMEKFAERYTNQNPTAFPTADVAFILAFSIIMLNTDLHNPSIKEDRRMTKEGFIRNNRGICDGQDLPEEMLNSIFDRIKKNPISLKEDDDARERKVEGNDTGNSIQTALSPAVFFNSHYDDLDKDRENNFQKERDQIVRTTESLLRRKRANTKDGENGAKSSRQKSTNHRKSSLKFVRTEDTGLRDEYVAPMFEVTWGPALAAFSTAMESANGTLGTLLSIATDEEVEHALENAAETVEVCLTGFRFAVCTAGLCGNETARDAYMLALSRFTQLGARGVLEPRHVRCIQTLLSLGKDDGELLGPTWEHVFKALSEVHRYHELFQLMARNDRAAAAAAERRRKRLEERTRRKAEKEERQQAIEKGDVDDEHAEDSTTTSDGSLSDEDLFSDDEEFLFDEEMDRREIDEANARVVYEAVSEDLVDAIYQRSASLSGPSIKEFVYQLCRVSRMEISGYGGHAGSDANTVDLTQAHYHQQHTLLNGSSHGADQPHHNQPDIYNLQKLVEVTHYNMDSRPRLVFSDIWSTVAAHLTSTALHSNAAVAMYAVDSFRQLSTQYLQREELGGFEFQRKFLKPFETVMSKSEHVSIKELLLKCIERIIRMFGGGEQQSDQVSSETRHLGTLRSGWRPVLAVLGIAGQDADERVSKMGFLMLTDQLRQCLPVEKDIGGVDKSRAGVLLAERFVDLVDALLLYVAGPHEEMSLVSIDHLVTLTSFLADKSFRLPLVRKRTSYLNTSPPSCETYENADGELELWWPILLGISRSMGDPRKQVRLKCMITLLGIINQHFFSEEETVEEGETPKHGDIQTLQLIFRGILTPVLEHATSDAHLGPTPPLPDDFERFATKPPAPLPKDRRNSTWLETTFEHFMDGCIAICMRSIDVFKEDILVEEIFAMLNSCTLSDSGGLAVRGLRRLQQFVTKDLNSSIVTDDTWATVCHMLRRCLSVRGLPQATNEDSKMNSDSNLTPDENMEPGIEQEAEELIREFVAEETIMQDRRYIGSNVTMIIGSLLSSNDSVDSMGLRWCMFLTSGLGCAVQEWEEAGTVLATSSLSSGEPSPPNYIETAIYGRKWMNKLILQLLQIPSSHNSFSATQTLVTEQTQSLLTLFLTKEASLAPNGSGATKAPSWEATQLTRVTKLLYEFIGSIEVLDNTPTGYFVLVDPDVGELSRIEKRNCSTKRSKTSSEND
eukprot:CAMPEP_0194232056 /NCGR_PEP_ID=MMETSP0158-20130606/570_1 /TAXON_ID=33649 /ORGANISM="Thalassionema nitzschioides, Strain L26-B" /LENGTH=2053 /DNA_ID=CAMNT_0038964771 /DNA_START=104 /DNA_END=6264 /DNA_ORIENTATION=+